MAAGIRPCPLGADAGIGSPGPVGGKVGGALRENIDAVKRNRRLNRLLHDLQLPVTLADLEEPRPNRQEVETLFDTLEFRTLRTRLFGEDCAAVHESLSLDRFRMGIVRAMLPFRMPRRG